MKVHHPVEAFIFICQPDSVFQGTEIIAEGEIPGRLHAAVKYLVILVHLVFRLPSDFSAVQRIVFSIRIRCPAENSLFHQNSLPRRE
jgi:hypothetical protein